jgi:FkbM family methyltransferase
MKYPQAFKRFVARFAFTVARSYLRYSPVAFGRAAVWEFARGYLAHYDLRAIARARSGARFDCTTADLVQSTILYFGEWEPSLTRFLSETLQEGDVFVDVGANIGYFSLLASARVGPTGRVISIDASLSNFAALQANLRRNGVENVSGIHAAVMDRRQTIATYFGDEGNAGHASVIAGHGTRQEGTVEAYPLSDLVPPADWPRIRVIKVDVEGAEAEVLRGLLSGPPLADETEVVVEINPEWLHQRGESADAVVQAFRARGFHVYELDRSFPWETRSAPTVKPVRGQITSVADIIFSRRPDLDTRFD